MPDAHQGLIRRRVWYSGRVQGVGFRYATVRVAERFAVAGWVRNLPDGRVEMVVEAESGELERFLAAIGEAMAGNIRGSDQRDESATGEFAGFQIR
ncbi:MAG: acylphosphatase [Planctomycetales bacterium]|nr:acylphosphatase [Planctomycetales bacterium]